MLSPNEEEFFMNASPSKQRKLFNFRTIIITVIVLFILLALTTGITYLITQNMLKVNKADEINSQKKYITYTAGEFLTNLADKGYIKLSMVYLLYDKNVERELQIKDSEIRDKINTILRSKTFDSVKDSKGMESLRQQIKEIINSILASGQIEDVFFTSIIVN
jgi:flagellar FliL protein